MATSFVGAPHAAKPVDMNVGQLIEFASDGLIPMFDPERRLFYHRLNYEPGRVTKSGLSHRYTMMTLLGLHRLESAGITSPIQIAPVLDRLLSDLAWANNIGDMGLLLWLVAVVAPTRLRRLYSSLQLESALSQDISFKEGHTMHLAWLLSGLSHASIALPCALVGCREIAVKCYELLIHNQGAHGFFGHQATWRSPQGLIRGRIGSFADQVYPIYGMTLFARAHRHAEALELAKQCGDAICKAQGSRGQWWWHYNAHNGSVFDNYPVYSVHQHGMAPMALFELGDEAGLDFSGPIFTGLSWIYGNNELGANMFDSDSRVIWRNIHKDTSSSYLHKVLRLAGVSDSASTADRLSVLHECRPYELGWLLYAFAERRGPAMPSLTKAF